MQLPTLPAEGTYSDIEHDFIENEPPGLFPTNQNSYWGTARKVFTDHLQSLADRMDQWYENLDPATVNVDDMSEWEEMLAIPDGTGQDLEYRRANVQARFERGPFTRVRRKKLVERFFAATFGVPIIFDPLGNAFTAGGIPFFSEATSLADTYRIYENVPGYSYVVRIKNSVTPDIPAMQRELERITPGHIAFTIDNTVANVLSYHRAVIDLNPLAYYRLNGVSAVDSTWHANNGSFPGGNPVAVAAPGLLHASVDDDLAGAGNGAADFNGTAHYLLIPAQTYLDMSKYVGFTLRARVRIDGLPTTGNQRVILSGTGAAALPYVSVHSPSAGVYQWRGSIGIDGVQEFVEGALPVPTVGQTYDVELRYDSEALELWVNNTLAARTEAPGRMDATTGAWNVGRLSSGSSFWDGVIDEVVLIGKPMTTAQRTSLYNTASNIP